MKEASLLCSEGLYVVYQKMVGRKLEGGVRAMTLGKAFVVQA